MGLTLWLIRFTENLMFSAKQKFQVLNIELCTNWLFCLLITCVPGPELELNLQYGTKFRIGAVFSQYSRA